MKHENISPQIVGRTHPLIVEAAEALGVETDMILAIRAVSSPAYLIRYGEQGEKEALLLRGHDGILQLVAVPDV
jgi:hypothetical protein